ncbi:MAG: hypothetical protein ACPIE8_02035, partial [Henriciella sp.]
RQPELGGPKITNVRPHHETAPIMAVSAGCAGATRTSQKVSSVMVNWDTRPASFEITKFCRIIMPPYIAVRRKNRASRHDETAG